MEKKKLFLLIGTLAILLVLLLLVFSKDFSKDPVEDDLEGERTYCEASQRDAEVCTMEYNPVCGNDLETYSNPCFACMNSDVEYYVSGEC